VLLASPEEAEREQKLLIQEEIQDEAIAHIAEMSSAEFEERLDEAKAKLMATLRAKNPQSRQNRDELPEESPDYYLHCITCSRMAVSSGDIRLVKNAHHVIVDPEFKSRVRTEPVNPEQIGGGDAFGVQTATMFCIEPSCRQYWGPIIKHEGKTFFVPKISKFKVETPTGEALHFNTWKDWNIHFKEYQLGEVESDSE
jgi:hypothetical protein